MKNIKVLGTGCAKCKNTITLINQVAEQLGVQINLEKIEDLPQIMAYGVMSTPAVVVNEQVVHKGSMPSREQIESWIKE
ncbi:MAG: small redox-active disulfide protein 2 [Psychromonas sp.]|jgi:small redox-active disulfide protein 2|uniref:thioredoxin family protein n=1 Tax=Psychromonas sp. TaxID=1884585 RepID=UPI0039E70332